MSSTRNPTFRDSIRDRAEVLAEVKQIVAERAGRSAEGIKETDCGGRND